MFILGHAEVYYRVEENHVESVKKCSDVPPEQIHKSIYHCDGFCRVEMDKKGKEINGCYVIKKMDASGFLVLKKFIYFVNKLFSCFLSIYY